MEQQSQSNVKIEVTLVEGPPKTALFVLEGYIQTREARILQSKLTEVEGKNVKRLVFDMKGVQYVSSAALGLLVTYSNKKKAEEGVDSVGIVGLPKNTRNVLETLGLLPMFPLFNKVDDAYSSFGIGTSKRTRKTSKRECEKKETDKKDSDKKD